jgi:hypothetical protein
MGKSVCDGRLQLTQPVSRSCAEPVAGGKNVCRFVFEFFDTCSGKGLIISGSYTGRTYALRFFEPRAKKNKNLIFVFFRASKNSLFLFFFFFFFFFFFSLSLFPSSPPCHPRAQ